MRNRTSVNALAVGLALVVWAGFYRVHHPHPPRIDPRPHEGVGEVLAGEAIKQLRPESRLIVIARDPKPFQVPAAEAQLRAFLRTCQRASRPVDELRYIRLDPLRLAAVPPGDFFDLLRLGRPDDVIVSFLGPPVLEPGQWAALDRETPRVLALCSSTPQAPAELPALFARGLLRAAVVGRPAAPARAGPGTAPQAFAQMFRLITPANLQDLAEATGSRP